MIMMSKRKLLLNLDFTNMDGYALLQPLPYKELECF